MKQSYPAKLLCTGRLFSAAAIVANLFVLQVAAAQTGAITGTWYLNEIEFEVWASSSPTERNFNDTVTLTATGEANTFVIDGADGSETITFDRDGNDYIISGDDITEGGTVLSSQRQRVRPVNDNLLIITRIELTVDIPNDDLRSFIGAVAIATREPLPQPVASAWQGNFTASETRYMVDAESGQISEEAESLLVQVNKMAGNTFRVYPEGESVENFWSSGNRMVSGRIRPIADRILYIDAEWVVYAIQEADLVRVVQVDTDTLVAISFESLRARLEARFPENHGNPPPENQLAAAGVAGIVLTRNQTPLQEVSLLATGCTGNYLDMHAQRLGDSQWYFIDWFGYFTPMGAGFGFHADHGTFYYGADCSQPTADGAWLYLADRNGWFRFSPSYPYGYAYDPQADDIISLL